MASSAPRRNPLRGSAGRSLKATRALIEAGAAGRPGKYLGAQSVPPGDISSIPGTKIIFNAPHDDFKHTYDVMVKNHSDRPIGVTFATNSKRLVLDGHPKVLKPEEHLFIGISCEPFDFDKEDTNNERVTIEWTNTPSGEYEMLSRKWFKGARKEVRRKNLPIEYNP